MSGNITKLTNSSNTTFRIAGGRTGVLLIHALTGTPAEMRFVATGLARAGYTVHCPTLAGHGGGLAEVVKTTWEDWYQSAEVALDELCKECDTVIVGGLCLGSIIGLHLAANHPDKIQGVALFSPTLWIDGWAMPWYTKLFSLIRTRWMANLMHFPDAESLGIKCPRVREFVRAALACSDGASLGTSGIPGGMVLEHRRLTVAARRLLGKVCQPTLIIHSREDDYASLDNAAYLQAKLAAPVDLCVLDDSYHMITLDRQRHVVVERTAAFIGRLVNDGMVNKANTCASSMRGGAA